MISSCGIRSHLECKTGNSRTVAVWSGTSPTSAFSLAGDVWVVFFEIFGFDSIQLMG